MICTYCMITKTHKDFSGHSNRCKPCKAAIDALRYPERYSERYDMQAKHDYLKSFKSYYKFTLALDLSDEEILNATDEEMHYLRMRYSPQFIKYALDLRGETATCDVCRQFSPLGTCEDCKKALKYIDDIGSAQQLKAINYLGTYTAFTSVEEILRCSDAALLQVGIIRLNKMAANIRFKLNNPNAAGYAILNSQFNELLRRIHDLQLL